MSIRLGDVAEQLVRAAGLATAVLLLWVLVARETERLGARAARYVAVRARARRRAVAWVALGLFVATSSLQLASLR